MKKLHTEIQIEASPEIVWETLLDFAAYPDWNPFIVSLEGTAKTGSKLRARIEPPVGKGMTFRPTVTAVEPGRYFEWLGTLGIKGLMDGRHQFRIEAVDGGTRFTQSEEFTGLLVPLLARTLDKGTPAGFELMNQAIKDRAEKTAAKRG